MRTPSALWNPLVNSLAASGLMPGPARRIVLSALGARIGAGADIRSGVRISTNQLTIGDRVFVNHGVHINNVAPVTIGDDVALAPDVLITTVSHEHENPARRPGPTYTRPVTIGDGCWIGARATILPGVTIGAGCIIAAGAVVTTDCEPHTLYGGVPARVLKPLPTSSPPGAAGPASGRP